MFTIVDLPTYAVSCACIPRFILSTAFLAAKFFSFPDLVLNVFVALYFESSCKLRAYTNSNMKFNFNLLQKTCKHVSRLFLKPENWSFKLNIALRIFFFFIICDFSAQKLEPLTEVLIFNFHCLPTSKAGISRSSLNIVAQQ